MAFDRPLYLMRAAGTVLVGWSLNELNELIACALTAGDRIESIHVYYAADPTLDMEELERVAHVICPI